MRSTSARKRSGRLRLFRLALLVGLLLTMAFILLVSSLGSQQFGSLHKLVLEATGPFQKIVTLGSSYLGTFRKEYLDVFSVREENKRLWNELQESRAALAKSREAIATNTSLRKLLELKSTIAQQVTAANVVGKDPSVWFRSVIIDRGTSSGVVKGSPVVNSDGVVGQVFSASPNYAKVLLAIAPSSAIDVLLQKSRVRGILKGNGTLTYKLEYILKTIEVKEGEPVVTAGYGGVFPTGLPVGTVSKIIHKPRGMFHEIEVTPTVDYQTLEHLLVLERHEEATP